MRAQRRSTAQTAARILGVPSTRGRGGTVRGLEDQSIVSLAVRDRAADLEAVLAVAQLWLDELPGIVDDQDELDRHLDGNEVLHRAVEALRKAYPGKHWHRLWTNLDDRGRRASRIVVGAVCGVSEDTVRCWLKRYRREPPRRYYRVELNALEGVADEFDPRRDRLVEPPRDP